jgi:hypothetical protein
LTESQRRMVRDVVGEFKSAGVVLHDNCFLCT